MEQHLAPAELLRFLQAEAETMQQLQAKISNELHLLQVEEDVYVRTLDRLNQKSASNQSTSTNGSSREETGGSANMGQAAGVELLEALHLELAPAVPPVSMVPPVSVLPPDAALPTTQLITAAEANGVEDMNVDSQLGASPGVGLVGDEYEEYELLDTLESEDEEL